MEALKIVCNHNDTQLIKENKILKEKIKKVDDIFKKINSALYDILWVSRRARTKEEFDVDYEGFKNKEELWKLCIDTKLKYKTIFEKLEKNLDDAELPDFIEYCEDYNKLMGVIGGIRNITSMYDEIMNPYKEEEKCDICDEDCECDICGKCLYGECKCNHYLNELEEDLFELDLNLDS